MSFKLWLSGLFARKKKPIRRTKRRDSIRLQLEQLEDRLVPTISIGGTSYATLQAAVNAATNGQTINIDTTGMPAGGYQGAVTISTPLTIAGPGSGQLPTIFAPTDGSLDGTHNAIFDVEGGASVTLSDLNITGSASDLDQGIYVGDGSTLTLASSSLQGIQNTSGNAVGVQVGNSSTGDAGIAFLSDDTIGGYQTAGIVIDGSGSSATIANTTVTGLSFAASAVQDGIIVSNGAVATISDSTVTDNSYLTGSMYNYSNSAGILFSSAGPGSSVTDSTVSGNVLGLVDFYSGSLTVAGSTWNNAYYNLAIDSASTTVIGNTLSGGTYGVAAFNQSGDTVDSVVNITGNTITNSMMAGIYATSSSTEAQPEVTANINYFGSSGTAVDNTTSNVIDATNNWWGSNSGPRSYQIAGSVTTSPYLVLNATMSASTVVSGQSLTLTADLTQNSNDQDTSYLGYLPNGIPVTFYGYNGMASPSTAYTVDGQASTTFTVGSASVPYAYGYANSGNATATADVSITQDGTTTSLSSSAGSAEYGQAATLTATVTAVSPGSGDATGYVYFYDGTDIIGSAYLSAGVATMTTTWLAVGDYSITAVYQGDGGYTASTSAACNLEVTEATTTTTITPSSDPAQLGQVVTFTAQVSAAFQGFSIPTGTVQFEIDGSAYGSPQTLGWNGQASIGISGLSTGPHTIVAVYSGDANYQGNTSDPLTETVANSVTTVASSLNPAQVEQNVTFTATVAAVVSGSRTPTGTVQFQVDGSNYGSPQTLDANGQATISDDSLAGGNYTITAIYSGDANFTASNDDSNPLTQVVVNDTTALSSSSDPSVVGQNVTLTANVSPVIGGATVPTGSVQFWDGSMELGTGFLDSTGTTTLTLSYLPAGTDNLTAVYGGDSNYTPSTSPPLAQVVELIGTSTAVTSSANPVGVNQSLTLTATITPDTQGSGSPYGTVDFYDDTSFLGSSYAYGGVANLYLSSLSFGDHSITAVFEGNSTFASSTSGTYVQQVFSSGAVNLTSSASGTVVYGQSITFTASVSYASGAAVPTGTMTFWSGSTNLGTVNLDDTGTATLSTTTLPVGYDSIDAVYSGDSNYAGGVSNYVYQSVQQDSTTTSLGASSTDVVYSAPLTLTATVAANAPGSGTPTGSVTFYNSGSYLGSASLISGVASLTLSNLSVGQYPYITTVYNGDSNFTGSTSSDLAVTIAEDGTTTSLATSGSPSVVGENVTFTATISPDSPGQGTPTGYVQFQIDGSDYGGEVWLYNGVASINDSSLSVAGYTITASYSGDGNFSASDDTADPLTQIVSQAGTTTTLVTSPGSSVYGQTVAFTATVQSASSSMFSPTGYVQFEVDGSDYGSPVQLNGGSATMNDAALSVGDPVVTAVYLGDSNFTGSTSTSVQQTVAQDATWTSLSASPQSSDYGQLVTLTATVYAEYPGSGTPTQTVTFMDGTNVLGTGTLSNGTATFSTATLSVGDHPSLTAVYGGDGNFTGSTSSSTDEEVYQASTQTLLSASENPAAVGDTVTFTATVSADSPSGAVPTGSVQFVDQSTDTVLATVSLSNGTASFATSSLTVGVHDIVANYLGTSSFWESSSSLTETVGYATTTTLAPSSGPSTFGQLVVLTATVTGSQGTPTGYVEFFDAGNELGSGYLNDGVASLYVYNLSGGNQTDITAYYEGDGTNNPSTSAPIDQLVDRASTSIAVSSNLQPSEVGQSVTLTATITPSTYEASPTGTVQFYVDGTAYGSPQPVYGDQITITDATLTAGAHSITVVYSGDGNFSGSNDNSSPLSQMVVNSVTSVGSSSDPSLVGQDVTFTATVSPVITGAGTPTGTVQFQIDGSNYGAPQSLNGSGQAVIDDAALTPGGHTITAVYSGDANLTGSSDTADPLTQTVSSSTTSLISVPGPSVYGQSVTLTATVSPVLSGAPIPTGYVEFFSGQSMLGGSYLNDEGVATCGTTDLAVGTNSLTAVYQGDSNFTASTSATATQVVNQAATTTVVTSPNNPAGLNQDVEFFATVTPTAPGGGDVDGEVNFYDGSTFLGSSYAYGGVAYFYTSSLSLGNHNITANFVGSSDYGASDSAVLDEVILDSSSITLISSANDTVYGQSVTFTATVTALTGSNMPTGSVSFYNGLTLLGTTTLNSSGVATFATTALPAGWDYINAVYSGDSNFAGSTSGSIYQYVLQDATTTTLSGSPGSTVYSDPVALTATVTANSPGFGTPTGSVYFYDSGSYLGWAPLNGSGVATLSDTTLFVGNHPSITAQYSGDSNFTYSSSSAIDETIAEDATTTSLTSSPNSSAPGQNVVFTATVSADSPGVGTPTGWVQFAVDGTNYGQAWLDNGQASISDAALSLGYHTITVSYSGDGNFAPSDDAADPLSQEVVAAPSVTTNPSNQTIIYGQTATFSAAASGFPVPTVQWEVSTDGGTTFSALSNGGMYSGVTTGTLTVNWATVAMSGYEYAAVFTNDLGTQTTTSASLSVNAASLIITANNQSTGYGAAIPSLTVSYSGFVNGDTVASLTTQPTVTTTASAGCNVGQYLIDASGAVDSNYSIAYVAGTLNVNPVALTITANNQSMDYGASLPALTVSYSGFVNGDTVTSLTTQPTVTTMATSTSSVLGGPYSIAASGAVDSNYTISYVAGSLTVNPAALTITADNQSKIYGQTLTLSGSGFTSSGLENGETVGSVTITASGGTAAYAPLGSYTLAPSAATGGTFNASNYAIAYDSGTLTVSTNSTTVIGSSEDPSVLGQNVIFTAMVSDVSPATGTPTGTVSFFDGSTLLGEGVLNSSGQASFSTSALSLGDHPSINAVYSGDANFAGSTSVDFDQLIESALNFTSIANGNWQTASTWMGGEPGHTYPIAGDTVLITNGFDVTIPAGEDDAAATVTLQETGSALTLTNSSTQLTVGSFDQSGGTVNGAGALTISSQLTWTGGTMSGSGTTVVSLGATLQLGTNGESATAETLDGWTLDNYGAGMWVGGQVAQIDGSEFHNEVTGSVTIDASGTWAAAAWNSDGTWGSASDGLFVNDGTVAESAGAGDNVLSVAFDNTSEGTVEINSETDSGTPVGASLQLAGTVSDSGTWIVGTGTSGTNVAQLVFSGGGTSDDGSFSVASDGQVAFAGGTFTLTNMTLPVAWAGQLSVTAGTLNLGSDLTVASYQQSGGILDLGADLTTTDFTQSGGIVSSSGSSDVTISVLAAMVWTGGTMSNTGSGTGTTLLGSATDTTATLQLGTAGNAFGSETLDGWTLANYGVGSWVGGQVSIIDGGNFDNETTGTLSLETAGGWEAASWNENDSGTSGSWSSTTSTGSFTNQGTITLPATTGTVVFTVAFTNDWSGAVTVDSSTVDGTPIGSTLNLAGTMTDSGTWTVGSGTGGTDVASVIFSGGGTTSGFFTLAGDGALIVSSGNLTVTDAAEFGSGQVSLTGGTLTLNSDFGVYDYSQSGGTLTNSSSDMTPTLTVFQSLIWTGGSMVGTGTTQSYGTLQLGSTTGSSEVLDGWTFDNDGVGTWAAGAFYQTDGSTFDNQLGGSLTVESTNGWYTPSWLSSSGPSKFSNEGLISVSVSGGTSWIGVAFNNAGSVEILTGTLSLQGGGTDDGSFIVPAGTSLGFDGTGATTNLTGSSSVTGTGTVEIGAGTVDVSGSFDFAGLTLVQGGALSFLAGADLEAVGTVQMSSGSAAFNTGNLDTLSSLTLSGGTLSGSDDVMVNGQLLWTDGDISGTGTLDAEGSLLLGQSTDSDDILTLDGWTLNNDYLATWAGGGAIYQINGSIFNNQAEAGLIIDNAEGWYTPSSLSSTAPGTFNNDGSVTILLGGGTSWFGVAFNNVGSVQVKNGTLSLQGGGSDDGSFTIGAGATLSFGGTGTTALTADSYISGVGTVEFAGGSVSEAGMLNLSGNILLDGGNLSVTAGADIQTIGSLNVSSGGVSFASGHAVSITTLDLSGGTLSGSDTLTVNGPFTWTGGTISGTGTLNAVGSLQIGLSGDTNDIETLAGWTINDVGLGVWAGGGAFDETSGAFNIETGASLDVQNANGWTVPTGTAGSGTFDNSGTLTVSAGAGTSWFGVPFDNAGSVQVLTGTLSLQGDGTDDGSFSISPGATLAFAGSGTTTLSSTSIVSGAGTLVFSGGTIDEEGTYSVSGSTLVSGGTVDFTSGASVQILGSLAITSGTVDFSTGSAVAMSALSISSGTLSGSDTLTVTSSYVCIGGTVTINLIVPGTAPIVTAGQALDAATGQEFAGTLGSFTDDGDGPYAVTINWGDGSSTTSGDYETNGNGGYDITGEHTYSTEGTFIVTVTATDAASNSTSAIDTAIVADSVNASAVSNISATIGQALKNQVVATFTDGGTSQPVGDYNAAINWGDGTTSPGTVQFDSATGTFSVLGSHTYSGVGTNTITVTVGHQSASTVQVTDSVNVGLTGAGTTLIAVAGTSTGTVTVATFSPAGSQNDDDYSATINWGDGTSETGEVTYDSATGLFIVTGAHTYSATGADTVSITVTYESVPTTFTTSAQVDGMPVIVTGLAVNAAAGVALTVPVATFVDPNGAGSVSSYEAFIDWGDGGTSTGTITSNGNGTFTVTGSYTYSTASSYTITVTVVGADDNSGTAESAATIGTPVLSAGIDDLQADQDNTVSGVIASFTDTNSAATLGNFTASINWGDNQTSAGTIVEDASGDLGVEASHTYAADGVYTFTVTITDNLGNSTIASATATVGESTVSVSALSLAPTAKFVFDGTVANFSDAGPWSETDDFTALINWGDGSADSEGTIVDNGDGTFGVEGTHTYSTPGSFPISVTVTDAADESGTATSTATVTALSMTPDPDTLILAQTESFSGTVITFDSGSGLTDPTPFDATINWGDGTSSTGSDVTIVADPNGGFDIQGSHTYAVAGSYTISVSLTDTNGDDFTGESTASVQAGNLAITQTANLAAAANQPFSGVIASFDDVNSTGDPTVYDATIDWGDGTSGQPDTSTGNVLLNDDSSFDIAGDHTYSTAGAYTVTVTLTDDNGDTATSSTTIAVQASPIAVSLASVAPTQQQEFSDVVATFTQIDPDATDFSASISWGDGNTTTGSIVANDDGSFSVYGDYTYANSGNFTLSVTVSDNDTPQNSVTASGTITVAAGSAPAAPDLIANELSAAAGIATSSTQPIAWFKDPSGDTNPADFSVVVAWGDDSSSTLTSSNLTSDGQGGFNIFASHTYEAVADDTFTVTVTNTTSESPAFSESTTGDFFVSPAVLTVQSDPLSLAPGQAFSGEVATFSDINDASATGSYSSIIEWGDGQTSAGTIVANGSGGFSVQGSHTYAEPGTYQVATLVFGDDGFSGSGTGSAVVAVPLAAFGGAPQAVQNQSFTGTVATFTGPSTSAGDYTASIDWGNGDVSAGTVLADGSGGFEVQGTETYAENGSFFATVTISDSAGDQTTANAAVNVAPAPLLASGDLLLTGAAGLTFTQMVAYFIPADPSATAGNFKATINWGDGSTSTSAGTDVTIVPDPNGGFDVDGTHAYAAVGSYTVTVTIVDPAGNTVAVTSTVNVVTASIAASGSDFSATAGIAYDDVLATFTSTNPSALASDFTAEITWDGSGDSSATTTGTIVANGDGSFSVEGDYTYASPGSDPVTVSITGPASTSAEVTETATVSSISVYGYGLNLGTDLAFDDTVAYFQTAISTTLTASINWGDGTTTEGTIVADADGGFDVQGTHTYTTAGSYSAVVTVSNPDDDNETGSDTAEISVAAAQLSVSATSITPVENQSFTGVVATFSAAADAEPGDFSATIDWGDGSTPTTIEFGSGSTAPDIVVDPNGGFDVIATHTYTDMNPYTMTVTVNDTAGDASSTDTATVQAVPLNVVGGNLNLQQGQVFNGIVGTIQDADASLTAASFDVVVTWGDGSSSDDVTLVPGSTSGVFDVEASHVYSSAGQYQPTLSVIDGDGNIQVGYGSAFVSPDYLSVAAASPTAGQGQSTTLLLATVTDPGVSGLSAQINWGSGPSVAGSIVDNGDGTFSVMGKYSFATLGTQPVTVAVLAGSASKTVTSDVNVVAATLTATLVDSGAVETLAFADQTLATFLAASSTATTGDFSAAIDWGDDSEPDTGTIVADSDGSFSVEGGHTYTATGTYSVVVTIQGPNSTSVTTTATINVAAIQITTDLDTETNETIDGTIARFYSSDTSATADDFTPIVTWGDGGTSEDATVVADPNGGFDVQASYAYANAGQFNLQVAVIDNNDGSIITASATMNVADDTLVAVSVSSLRAVQGQSTQLTLATITDPTAASVSSLSAQIIENGQIIDGTIDANGNGTYSVAANLSFAAATNYSVQINMRDGGGQTTTLTEPVTATPAMTVTQSYVVSGEGQTVSGDLVMFSDADNLSTATSCYSVTINWGDGETSTDADVTPNGGGSFTVSDSHTYETTGSYRIWIEVTNTATGASVGNEVPVLLVGQAAYTWTGGSGNWNDPTHWSAGGVATGFYPGEIGTPASAVSVVIGAGVTVTVPADISCSVVSLGCAGNLTIQGNLAVSGNSTVSGNLQIGQPQAAGGTLNLSDGVELVASGGGVFYPGYAVTMGTGAQLVLQGPGPQYLAMYYVAQGNLTGGTLVAGRNAIVCLNADANPYILVPNQNGWIPNPILNPNVNANNPPAVDKTITNITNLSILGGDVEGIGTLNVTGSLTWNRGTLGGPGLTLFYINVAGGMSIANNVHLNKCTLVNGWKTAPVGASTATWQGGRIYSYLSAFVNYTTFVVPANARNSTWSSFEAVFQNYGIFQQETTRTVTMLIEFNSYGPSVNNNIAYSGLVEINQGTLQFGQGAVTVTATGGSVFNIAAGAVLQYEAGSSFSVDKTSSITGAGSLVISLGWVEMQGSCSVSTVTILSGGLKLWVGATYQAQQTGILAAGTLTVNTSAGATSTNVMLAGGNLDGTGGVFTVNRSLWWMGGSISGTGTLKIASTAFANFLSARPLSFGGETIDNYGRITLWPGVAITGITGSRIINHSGASFIFEGSGSVTGICTFVNWGTVQGNDMTAQDVVAINVNFTNRSNANVSGNVNIPAGTLRFGGGGSATTASLNLGSGITLVFAGGTFNLSGTVNPNINLTISGGTANFSDPNNEPLAVQRLTVMGTGIATFAQPVSTGDVLVTGGTANFESTFFATYLLISNGNANFGNNASANQMDLDGGTLGGAGAFTVLVGFEWTGGGMAAGGNFDVGAAASPTLISCYLF